MSEQDRAKWHKVDTKDRMAPWNYQIRQYIGTLEERCVADHLNSADADRIIADHRKAAKADALAKALELAKNVMVVIRPGVRIGHTIPNQGDLTIAINEARVALADWAEVGATPEGVHADAPSCP